VNLTYRENYCDDEGLKRQLIGFIKDLFNLDLTYWNETGFWDTNFRPFAFFEDRRLIANVSVYSMDMTILGERCRVAQFASVGTLEEYRRRGLSAELTKRAMDWADPDHEFYFLFADLEAYPFYASCGFRRACEHKVRITLPGGDHCRPGAEKLTVQRKDRRELLSSFVSERASVSNILGIHTDKLFMLWGLYMLKDSIYHISDLDILVLYKRDNGGLTIFDIVGREVPPFAEIYPYICAKGDEWAEFLFMTDKLNLDDHETTEIEVDNGIHLHGVWPLGDRRFIIPFTGQS